MTAPFLNIADFTAEYQGTLTAGETTTVTRLLQVVSDWIRGKTSDADATSGAQVVFEVVRDAANYGALEKLSSFENRTSLRHEIGTFDEDLKIIDDYLTPRHKRLLGIPLSAGPQYSFPVCDY